MIFLDILGRFAFLVVLDVLGRFATLDELARIDGVDTEVDWGGGDVVQ